MTSTYLSYKIYANDMAQSLQRVAGEPVNARDRQYYEANIGKVKSVDDFISNYRLFTYAMNAYGLQDLGNAKAFMKKVLESDLSDPKSFANSLNDSRYKAFAKAYSFTKTGTVASSGQLQTSAQRQDLLGRLNLSAAQAASLESSLDSVTSFGALRADSGLYSEVLSAYGLNASTTLGSDVMLAIESDLSDPASFANRTENAKFRPLAEAFNFAKDGSVAGARLLQSAQNTAATTTAYASTIGSSATAQAAGQIETAYFAQKMPELTSVDQLLADPRLVAYVKTAFGIDATVTTSQLRSVLTSNLLDTKSTANTLGADPTGMSTTPTRFQLLASAFSIGADGTADDHGAAISAANLATATAAYTTAVGTAKDAAAAGAMETDYFTAKAPALKSADALLADSRLVAYVKTAFNLPKATTSDLDAILKSNLLDPTSAANTMGVNARQLAAAFNFSPSGLAYDQRQIQSMANVTATTTAYASQVGGDSNAQAAAKTETAYYTSTVPRLKSIDDLLSNKRLVAYLTKAYAITGAQPAKLHAALTSDVLDPRSAANKLGGGYLSLAAAFDVANDGTIAHPSDRTAQSKSGVVATNQAYLEQMLESEAGDQSEGTRLALYFKRMAPSVTSAYALLGDKALTKVVHTILGLPDSASKADIDAQARTVTSHLNLADLKDPKKLDRLIARFAALYDLTNTSSSDSSSTSLLV